MVCCCWPVDNFKKGGREGERERQRERSEGILWENGVVSTELPEYICFLICVIKCVAMHYFGGEKLSA